MSLSEIQPLLDGWRGAERALDGLDPEGPEFAARGEVVRDTREEYLETVRARAGRHRYAAGSRMIQADIADPGEAEEQRAKHRSTPEYHQAVFDVRDRNDRIVIRSWRTTPTPRRRVSPTTSHGASARGPGE